MILYILLFINIILISCTNKTNIAWLQFDSNAFKNVVPIASSDQKAIAVNNIIYVYGGYNDNYDAASIDWYQNKNVLTFNVSIKDNYNAEIITNYATNFDFSNTVTDAPNPRTAHTMVYNPVTSENIVFSGYYVDGDTQINLNDLWAFSINSNTWRMLQDSNISATGRPVARSWATFTHFVKDDGCTYALLDAGAIAPLTEYFHDTWVLNLSSLADGSLPIQWTDITDITTPLSGAEGARMVANHDYTYLYRFGGYNCSDAFESLGAGDKCYSNAFYQISTSDYSVTQIVSPNAPSNRAYHSCIYYNYKIYVIGGAYTNLNGLWEYYNDVHVYDFNRMEWLIVNVYGTKMTAAWSISGVLVNNAICIYAGNDLSVFYNNFAIIYPDIVFTDHNFYVSASSLSSAVAGVSSSFVVQMRSYEYSSSNEILWGDVLPWATDLDFSILFVGTSNVDGNGVVTSYSKKDTENFIDNLDGTYTINYVLNSGSEFKVFISYYDLDKNERDEILGSPFSVLIFF